MKGGGGGGGGGGWCTTMIFGSSPLWSGKVQCIPHYITQSFFYLEKCEDIGS